MESRATRLPKGRGHRVDQLSQDGKASGNTRASQVIPEWLTIPAQEAATRNSVEQDLRGCVCGQKNAQDKEKCEHACEIDKELS